MQAMLENIFSIIFRGLNICRYNLEQSLLFKRGGHRMNEDHKFLYNKMKVETLNFKIFCLDLQRERNA